MTKKGVNALNGLLLFLHVTEPICYCLNKVYETTGFLSTP